MLTRCSRSSYCRFNKPALIYPDPLVFAHQYANPADRETAALDRRVPRVRDGETDPCERHHGT